MSDPMNESCWQLGESGADAADTARAVTAARSFVAPIVRLLPDALIRLRAEGGMVQLWSFLPLDVLVRRDVPGAVTPVDVTVRAGDLDEALVALADPANTQRTVQLPQPRDAQWRGALPLQAEERWIHLDAVPGAEVLRLVRAGRDTFLAASQTAAHAEKMGRALLDHEAIVVSDDSDSVPVPLRVLQALATMRFIRADEEMVVSASPAWARFSAGAGAAYQRRSDDLALLV